MSVKKVAGLVAGFALVVGLIGGGVSAAFTDSVSAVQNIHVGTLACSISSASGTVVGKTLTYTVVPDIASSAPGSAPFSFTVSNTGTIPAVLLASD